MITPLPVFHMNALVYSFMAMLSVGGCLIALDRFHPQRGWQDVAASGATCLHYLGTMPTILMDLPRSPNDRSHRSVSDSVLESTRSCRRNSRSVSTFRWWRPGQ